MDARASAVGIRRNSGAAGLGRKVVKRARQVSRHGPGGLLWLAYRMGLAKPAYSAAQPLYEIQRRALRRARASAELDSRLARLRGEAPSAIRPDAGPAIADLSPALAADLAGKAQADEVRLAEFDQDGALLPLVDSLWDVPTIGRDAFLPRDKFKVWLVARGGRAGVRKEFGTQRGAFLNELEALMVLGRAGCAVPAILAVDFDANAIVQEYVDGPVLRETLAAAGARIRDRDVAQEGTVSTEERIRRGRAVLPGVLDDAQVARLAAELKKIHAAGYVLQDIKYGNVIIENGTGRPRFIDFELALPLAGASQDFSIYLRDTDRRKFNAHFGEGLITRELLGRGEMPGASSDTPERDWGSFTGVYAPATVGAGLSWGPIWNTDVGIGRWNFIMKDNLPIPQGGTVLDLGANNGFNALQMIKSGAASATAVEIDPMAIRQGLFLRDVYEWSDNRPYDLRYVQGSHGALPELSLPRFDLVTAFCTLYYLDDAQMDATVAYIAEHLTDVLVLQCNTDRLIDRTDEKTFQRASIEYATALLRRNGFTHFKVVAPNGYSRPLVIGRKPTA